MSGWIKWMCGYPAGPTPGRIPVVVTVTSSRSPLEVFFFHFFCLCYRVSSLQKYHVLVIEGNVNSVNQFFSLIFLF